MEEKLRKLFNAPGFSEPAHRTHGLQPRRSRQVRRSAQEAIRRNLTNLISPA